MTLPAIWEGGITAFADSLKIAGGSYGGRVNLDRPSAARTLDNQVLALPLHH